MKASCMDPACQLALPGFAGQGDGVALSSIQPANFTVLLMFYVLGANRQNTTHPQNKKEQC